MKTTLAIESHDSPAPGIIPEPARVHEQPAAPAVRADRRAAGRANKPATGKPTPLSVVLAKALSAIRGDKYMVGAYPPEWHGNAATRNGGIVLRSSHNGLPRPAPARPNPEPREAEHAAPPDLPRMER